MGLVKRTVQEPEPTEDRRSAERDVAGLIGQLDAPEADVRRWAAIDLAAEPAAADALADRLEVERSKAVRDALVTALVQIGTPAVARRLAVHLGAEDAGLRNAAVEALAEMPATAEVVPELLADPVHDVRVLTVMVLAALRDPRVPGWLLEVATSDPHPNVCGAAVDALAEAGDAEMRPALEAVPARFPEDPFLPFAVRATVERLSAGAAA